jgi:DNA-binding LacI/PurR family transcriptional regulator
MERPGRPTIHDIARRAGVSKSLVSLVLRDSPHVSDEKRRAVLAAVDELGYRPNVVARSLVRRESNHLGVMISDFNNPFFPEVVAGLEDQAHLEGYRLIMNTGRRVVAQEEAAIESLIELQVDGLVLAGARVPMRSIQRAAESLPLVLVSRSSLSRSMDVVVTDDRAGAAAAVEHLVRLGHRRIAHIDGGSGANARTRRLGYENAMRRCGLGAHIQSIRGAFTPEGGAEGVHELFRRSRPPTAIFAANDICAIGAIGALEARGLQVPDEVSVVGYDDGFLASLPMVELTTINQPKTEMGRTAVEILLERIRGERDGPRRVVMPPRLVTRRTTAPPPRTRG